MANINKIQLELILETCNQNSELTSKQIKNILTIIASSQLYLLDQFGKFNSSQNQPNKEASQKDKQADKQKDKEKNKQIFQSKGVKQQFVIGMQIPSKTKEKLKHEEAYDQSKKEVLEMTNRLENRIVNMQQKMKHLGEIQKNVSLIVSQNLDLKQGFDSKIANLMLQINEQNRKGNTFSQLISKVDNNNKILEEKIKETDGIMRNIKQNIKQDIAKLLMRELDEQINKEMPKQLPTVLQSEMNGKGFNDKIHQIFLDHMSFHIDEFENNLKSIDYEIWKIKYSLKELQEKLTQRLYESSFNKQGNPQKGSESLGMKQGLNLNPILQQFIFKNQSHDYEQRARARKQQEVMKEKEKLERYNRLYPNQPVDNLIQMEKFAEELQKRTRLIKDQSMMMGMPLQSLYQQQSNLKISRISSQQDLIQQEGFSEEEHIEHYEGEDINLGEKKKVFRKKKNKNLIKIEDWIDNSCFYYHILKKNGSLLSSKCQCYAFGNRISGQIWRYKVKFTKKQPNIGVGISDSSYRVQRVLFNHPSYFEYRTNGCVYRGGVQKPNTLLRPFNKGEQLQIQVNINEKIVTWRADNKNIHIQKWTQSQSNTVTWVPFIHFYAKDSIRIIK